LAELEITHPEMNDLCWGNDPEYRLPEEVIQRIEEWINQPAESKTE
jgi:hypothetical protein